MHKFKIEIWENDENGNPMKATRTVLYADTDDGAEEIYTRHREATTKRADGLVVRTYTITVSVQAYKQIASPGDYFAQYHC